MSSTPNLGLFVQAGFVLTVLVLRIILINRIGKPFRARQSGCADCRSAALEEGGPVHSLVLWAACKSTGANRDNGALRRVRRKGGPDGSAMGTQEVHSSERRFFVRSASLRRLALFAIQAALPREFPA